MSKKLAVVAVAFGLFFVAGRELRQLETARNPASLDDHRHESLRHTHKLSSGMKVRIVAPEDIRPQKVVHLKGVVESSLDLSEATLMWHIPDGVEVLEGETQMKLTDLKSGGRYESNIVIKQWDLNNRQVHLSLSAKQGDMEFSELAQLNTLAQKDLDIAVKRLNQRHLKYLEENASSAGREPSNQ